MKKVVIGILLILVLVFANGDPMSPTEYAENVMVTVAKSSSGVIVENDKEAIADEIVNRGVLLEDNFLQLR